MKKIQSKVINGAEIEYISASIVGESVYFILFDANSIEKEKGFIECGEINEEQINDILINHFGIKII